MSRTPLSGVDLVLADLDGVVYQGRQAIPYAIDALSALPMPVAYLTNNASRRAETVAEHLRGLGLPTDAHHVVTSPQAAIRLLARHVREGEPVLVVGGDGLTSEVERAGWRVVRTAAEHPVAVVQGFAPEVGWKDLAEASFALHRGIPWVATNTDWTIPVEGGIAPGNGTLVGAVHTAVGRLPEVAGKPEQPIFDVARERFQARDALMIGDRLDTDIWGANRAGLRSLLVLTGIDQPKQVLAALEGQRPDYIVPDLRGLTADYPVTDETLERSSGDRFFEVGTAVVRVSGNEVRVLRAGEDYIDTLRAGAAAVWRSGLTIHQLRVDPALWNAPERAESADAQA